MQIPVCIPPLAKNPLEIENQSHAPIAENGAPCNTGNLFEGLAEGLDDDFLFTDKFIDHEAKAATLRLRHQQNTLTGILTARYHPEPAIEPDHR